MDVTAVPRRVASRQATTDRAAAPDESDSLDEELDKPMLLGYIRRDLVATAAEVQKLERQMSLFAQSAGFSMGFVFIDEPDIWPAVFETLIEALRRHRITAVVLPSLLHLAVLGATHDIKGTLERATGTRVLLLDSR